MKTSLCALAFFFLHPLGFSGQITLDSTAINRFYYTAKVWGYVKYFHSEVANGKHNWDSVLIETVWKVNASGSDAEFNATLRGMIDAAGEMALPTGPHSPVPDSLKFNLDLRWFNDPALSLDVRSALDTIRSRFRPQSHYLVGEAFSGGNPTFFKDSLYYLPALLPEREIRMLALFRYWNIFNYFAPGKYLIDTEWDRTLKDFIPRFWDSRENYSYYRSMLELSARIDDSHAFTNNSYVNSQIIGTYSLPFKLRFVDGETVVVGVLDGTSGIERGDIIRK